MKKISVTLVGGSGYIGGEVLRLLLGHPAVDLICATANESAGTRVDEHQPNLRGFTDLVFAKHEEAKPADVTFLSLPHGETAKHVPAKGKVIDLSGDFRLRDRKIYETYYKKEHPAWDLQKEFVTGIPEIHRAEIGSARYVAVGGCFASCAILSIHPITSRRLHEGRIIVDGKTGSSGSGAKPSAKTHHPFRAGSFFAYEPFHHRHQPEIEQATGAKVLFQPHSTPLVRGVFTTSYVPLREEMTTPALLEIFRQTYEGSPFVRLQEGSPNVNWTRGSNFIDIGVQAEGRTAVVFGAIDNLLKGGAGQAVQCMNLMFGFEETAGLRTAPSCP